MRKGHEVRWWRSSLRRHSVSQRVPCARASVHDTAFIGTNIGTATGIGKDAKRERESIELAADDGREGALALVKAPLGDLHHLLFNSMSAIRAYSILFQGTM